MGRGRWLGLGIALLALLTIPVGASPLQAATIVVDETIDIAGYTGSDEFFPIDPVTIAVGDSVDLTVRFSDDLSLHMGDGNEVFTAWLGLSSTGNAGGFMIANVQVQFLGFQGTGGAPDTLTLANQTAGSTFIGPMFDDFLSSGQSVEFTGYNATYDVTSLPAGGAPNSYDDIFFRQLGDDVSVVPEPSTFALTALGLLGLGASRRGRRPAAA